MPYSFTGDIVLRFTVSVNKYFPRESFRGIMPEDSIGMNAGCFVRIFGHSVFVLGRRSCRRAFRHVCVEFRFSPLREPCPPAHSIRVVAQPNIHRGFSVARFRYDLPARRLREPRARFDGVLSSPSPLSSPSVPIRSPSKPFWRRFCWRHRCRTAPLPFAGVGWISSKPFAASGPWRRWPIREYSFSRAASPFGIIGQSSSCLCFPLFHREYPSCC